MPNSTKKKKAKAADFSKAKLKLGKGRQVATNATDTSFKARSIAIPNQNIASTKGEEPVTRRNQALEDILSHLRHYNATIRRDALSSLREVLRLSQSRIEAILGVVIESCSRLVGDEDPSVRKALHSFLEWFLPSLPIRILRPHILLLVLHTTSNLTHIFPEMRIDAVRVLNIVLNLAPDQVVAGWSTQGTGARILDSLCGLLHVRRHRQTDDATESFVAFSLSATSKVEVLRCFSGFLSAAVGVVSSSRICFPTWCFRHSFDSDQAYNAFVCSLRRLPADEIAFSNLKETFVEDWPPFCAGEVVGSAISALDAYTVTFSECKGSNSELMSQIADLSHDLQPMLLATFQETVAVVLSPERWDKSNESINVLSLTLRVMKILYASILRESSILTHTARRMIMADLSGLMHHMAFHFPYTLQVINGDLYIEQALQRMNEIFCELSALAVFATESDAQEKPIHAYTTEIVSQYVTDWLYNQRDHTAETYCMMVPTIWALLNQGHLLYAEKVFPAVIAHAQQVASSSTVAPYATEYVSRLVLLQSNHHYVGQFHVPHSAVEEVQRWVATMPRILWEVGSKHLLFTESIFFFLLRAIQQGNQTLVMLPLVLGQHLAPFFHIVHPTRGFVHGPYSELPPHLQRLAHTVARLCTGSAEIAHALQSCGLE